MDKKTYEQTLEQLQIELIKMHTWVRRRGEKVVVIFEGRDAAGEGKNLDVVGEPDAAVVYPARQYMTTHEHALDHLRLARGPQGGDEAAADKGKSADRKAA